MSTRTGTAPCSTATRTSRIFITGMTILELAGQAETKQPAGQSKTKKLAGQTAVTRSEQALSSTLQGEQALSSTRQDIMSQIFRLAHPSPGAGPSTFDSSPVRKNAPRSPSLQERRLRLGALPSGRSRMQLVPL